MDKQTLEQFESLCIQDEPPACQTMCPLHLESRTFIRLLKEGKTGEARKLLDRHLPLSGLTAYLCEGPCREHCRRAEIDDGIDLPFLERFCVSVAKAPKPMALPGSGKSAAIIGGGLSSLAAAWELAKKGIKVKLFHSGPPGGYLRSLPKEKLPSPVLAEALELLRVVKVDFEEALQAPSLLEQAGQDFDLTYIGLDEPGSSLAALGFSEEEARIDELTLATGREKIFAGPSGGREQDRFIEALEAGRRAAGSISRVFSGASPSAAREGEAVWPTRLYTDLTNAGLAPQVPAADPLSPTGEEALAETERCLQCQCLECVKRCAFMRHYKGYPKKFGREIYNNISTAFGIRHSNTMINSCAQCGLCKEICPNGADLGAFTRTARLEMVQTKHMPVSAHEFALEDLVYSNSPEVAFFRHQPGREKSRWLFFPGCQLPASLPGQTMKAYEHMCSGLEGGIGFMLACCGAPARWSGRPELTAKIAEGLRKAWHEAGKPRLIAACASCKVFFQAELPEIPVISLWDTLAGLPLPQGARNFGQPVAVHDPCAARLAKETQNRVRSILGALGQPYEEPPLAGGLTRCCGYGGLADAANPEVGELYALDRAEDSSAPYLAWCIMCRDRLKSAGKESVHLLDALFPHGSVEEAFQRPAPGISDRREGRLTFRRSILQALWGEIQPEEVMNEDLAFTIAEELAPLMEKRRILRSDVAAVLAGAKDRGAHFHNRETGRSLAALRPRQVTFWVEYAEEADGSFTVYDAYCHRMVAPGVPGDGAESPATQEGYAVTGGRL